MGNRITMVQSCRLPALVLEFPSTLTVRANMATLRRFIVRAKKPTDIKKEEGTFHYRNISGDESIFYYGFLIKSKRLAAREKLQALRLHINSKTIGL